MPKGITLSIAADTQAFDRAVRSGIVDPLDGAVEALDNVARAGETAGGRVDAGMRNAERALDDVADAGRDAGRQLEGSIGDSRRELADLADAGKDAGRQLEDGMRDAERKLDDVADAGRIAGEQLDDSMRDAQRSTDNLSDEMRTLRDRIEDSTRKTRDLGDAGRRAGGDYDDGMRRASDGVEDFRDEARQTATETAASFGSVEDAIDGVQELAANGLAGFGPAGVAAGIAVAGAIGLGVTAFEQLSEAEEESRRRAAEWASAYMEAGANVLDSTMRAARAQEIMGDPDRRRELADNAREWGVAEVTALRAMTGEHEALAIAEASLAEREREAAAAQATRADGGEVLSDMLVGQTAETRNGREALEALTREMQQGAADANTYSAYLVNLANTTAGATREVDEFGDTVVTLPDGKQVYIDAETGRATDNIDAIEGRLYSIPDATANVRVNTSSADRTLSAWMSRQLTMPIRLNAIPPRGTRLVT